MKIQKLLLAAAITLIASNAIADWQPYFGMSMGGEDGTFKTHVGNPPLAGNYLNISNFTDSTSGPFDFSAHNDAVMPTIEAGLADTFSNNVYLGFNFSAGDDSTTYNSNAITDTVVTYSGPNHTGSATLNNSFADSVSTSLSWRYSATVQLGYFATPQFMPFIEAGVSTVKADSIYTLNDVPDQATASSGPVFNAEGNIWLWGPTVGVGAQYSLTPHMRLFGKVDYARLLGNSSPSPVATPYATNTFPNGSGNSVFTGISSFKQNYTFTAWTAEIGANYYF